MLRRSPFFFLFLKGANGVLADTAVSGSMGMRPGRQDARFFRPEKENGRRIPICVILMEQTLFNLQTGGRHVVRVI